MAYSKNVNKKTLTSDIRREKTTIIKHTIFRITGNSYINLNSISVVSKSRILLFDNNRLNNATITLNELKNIIEKIKKTWFSDI